MINLCRWLLIKILTSILNVVPGVERPFLYKTGSILHISICTLNFTQSIVLITYYQLCGNLLKKTFQKGFNFMTKSKSEPIFKLFHLTSILSIVFFCNNHRKITVRCNQHSFFYVKTKRNSFRYCLNNNISIEFSGLPKIKLFRINICIHEKCLRNKSLCFAVFVNYAN